MWRQSTFLDFKTEPHPCAGKKSEFSFDPWAVRIDDLPLSQRLKEGTEKFDNIW